MNPLARALLLPAGALYGAAVRLRGAAYDRGLLPRHRLAVPVVSIGNLTFGGTGKTPTTAALARAAVQRGFRPAVLTRGYRRSGRGQLVLLGPDTGLGWEQAGDEPLELARRLPGVPIVVDGDRVAGGRTAVERGADLLLLDDGFQHRRLARDVDVVLLDVADPWGGRHLPPRGRLREPLAGLARAQVVVLSKAGEVDAERLTELAHEVRTRAPQATVMATRLAARRVWTPEGAVPPQALAGRRVVAVAGLARPEGFAAGLAALGAEVVELCAFADHHAYGEADLARVRRAAAAAGAVAVTTAKDAVKLPPDAGLWVLEVAVEPLEGGWDAVFAALERP